MAFVCTVDDHTQQLKVTSSRSRQTGSITKIEADSSFDLLHISFNLSTCVSEHGFKKMEITFIYAVLTVILIRTVVHSHPPLRQN